MGKLNMSLAFNAINVRNLSGAHVVLAQRLWQAFAGLVTLAAVAHFLTPAEQGYFYTMSSIAALYMVLDMGLATVLVQFSAREFAGLSWGKGGAVEGDKLSRFLGLTRLSIIWYLVAAFIFLLVSPMGAIFIESGRGIETLPAWHSPWKLLVVATALGLAVLPVLALIEGSGSVTEVYAVRLAQGIVGSITAWLVLAQGGGLYAAAMIPLMAVAVAVVWILLCRKRLLLAAFRYRDGGFDWRHEVWPLQWRIGASWLAGYALVSMNVPLLFQTQGAIVAGQMGVTISIANMLSLLALSWLTAKVPAMVSAAAEKRWDNLEALFNAAFHKSLFAYAVGALLFLTFRFFLDATPYGARLLPMSETAGLVLAMGFYHLTSLFAGYLRAYLREPLLKLSLSGALIAATGAILVAPYWGSAGVVTVLLLVNGLYFFPGALFLRHALRKKWQG